MKPLPNCMAVVVDINNEIDTMVSILSRPFPSEYSSRYVRFITRFGSAQIEAIDYYGCVLITQTPHSWTDIIIRTGDLIYFEQYVWANHDWVDIYTFEKELKRGQYDNTIKQILSDYGSR